MRRIQLLVKLRKFGAPGLEPFRGRPLHLPDNLGEGLILAQAEQHMNIVTPGVIAMAGESSSGKTPAAYAHSGSHTASASSGSRLWVARRSEAEPS
jgi:hypothetical protein